MLRGTKYHILNPLTVFRWFNLRFDYSLIRSMSEVCPELNIVHDEGTNDIQKNNKRQITDENVDVPAKVQKIDEANSKDVVQRIKKRNYAVMLSYLGRDYYGMQKNPGMKTIEEDLLNAFLKANLITAENFENLREINFQRAARTDKGVSAVRQIVSVKLPEVVDVSEINRHLPNEIRVFGAKRVTKGFNSKNQCNARTYRYVLPTYSFAREDPSFLQSRAELDVEKRIEQLSTIDEKPYTEFRLSAEMLDKINACAKMFEGTHNFHNFTSKTRPLDPRAYRYIINFRCIETFISNDMEFAVLEVKGQSFMLHQIRKMVGLIIGIARNIITEDIFNEVFTHEKLNMPTAPSLGLALNYVHYDNYNKRYGDDGIHETLNWTEADEDVERFKKEYILKHVVDTEIAEKTVLMWLAEFLTADRFTVREEPIAL